MKFAPGTSEETKQACEEVQRSLLEIMPILRPKLEAQQRKIDATFVQMRQDSRPTFELLDMVMS